METMLKNEKYTGDVLVVKTYSEGYPKGKRKVNQGERDQFIALGTHPALLPTISEGGCANVIYSIQWKYISDLPKFYFSFLINYLLIIDKY